MKTVILPSVAVLTLLGAGPAAVVHAQTDETVPAAGAKKAPDGTTPEERANTARLNAEQAASAKAEIEAYQAAVAAAEQQQAAAQAKYAEETAAYEAEKARLAAMSAEERMRWEADVAACKAGDKSRCAKPATPPEH